MALLISVAPTGDGWAVWSDTLNEAMVFDAGAHAERAARALAAEHAADGGQAEVRIFLRDGALAGRFLHPAQGEPLALAG
jgi:hypothetical protein